MKCVIVHQRSYWQWPMKDVSWYNQEDVPVISEPNIFFIKCAFKIMQFWKKMNKNLLLEKRFKFQKWYLFSVSYKFLRITLLLF